MHAIIISVGILFSAGMSIGAHATDLALQKPSDLRQEAQLIRTENQPLILFFSLPKCEYCKVVRENYLRPLLNGGVTDARPLIREIDITSNAPLKGFGGEPLTEAQFAKSYKVKVAPTVIMVDAAGTPLADRLVGSDMAGFYGAYFDNALAKSRESIKQHSLPAQLQQGLN